MSPRAAWRFEVLGFDQVVDYLTGKVDWRAAGLPTSGRVYTAGCFRRSKLMFRHVDCMTKFERPLITRSSRDGTCQSRSTKTGSSKVESDSTDSTRTLRAPSPTTWTQARRRSALTPTSSRCDNE
jgi:hypothetical protein